LLPLVTGSYRAGQRRTLPRQSTSAGGTASLLGALVMADDFVLMHDVENACAEFAQLLETHAEFLRRHPGLKLMSLKGKSLTSR
jgi:hypothetical protein